jgi:hypothetical protein
LRGCALGCSVTYITSTLRHVEQCLHTVQVQDDTNKRQLRSLPADLTAAALPTTTGVPPGTTAHAGAPPVGTRPTPLLPHHHPTQHHSSQWAARACVLLSGSNHYMTFNTLPLRNSRQDQHAAPLGPAAPAAAAGSYPASAVASVEEACRNADFEASVRGSVVIPAARLLCLTAQLSPAVLQMYNLPSSHSLPNRATNTAAAAAPTQHTSSDRSAIIALLQQ